MPFLGIFADPNHETYTRKALEKDFSSQQNHVIFIHHQNMQNIKNIRFDTILIDTEELMDEEALFNIVRHAKTLIINSDLNDPITLRETLNLQVITFGFNPKATVTLSSVTEESILMCIQRNIRGIKGEIIEPQEIKINIKKPLNIMPNTVIGIQILRVIYNKI